MATLVILGNGVAGISAARHVRQRSDDRIVVVSAESDHFFSRTALMYIYQGHLSYEATKPYEDGFWGKNRIELLRARVVALDPAGKKLRLDGGGELSYDRLLLATGSRPRLAGWPGQDLKGAQGLYSLQDLTAMEAATRGIGRAAVVGGGLIGVEMAEMLHSRGIAVTFLVRERSWMAPSFPAEESAMIGDEIRAAGIDLRLGEELAELLPDGAGRLRGLRTWRGEEIACQFAGLTIGVEPNVEFLRGTPGLEIARGILVDDFLRTSLPEVYAAGDCAELRRPRPERRATEPLWYVARAMGETLAPALAGLTPREYDPGIFFNSAKFFDLEWQVYGRVPAFSPPGEDSFFWRHPAERKSLRIHFRREDQSVLGFSVLGIRLRQEACAAWIARGTRLPEVLPDLAAAHFDPELYARHEPAIVAAYNRQFPDAPVALRRKRGLDAFFALLRGEASR